MSGLEDKKGSKEFAEPGFRSTRTTTLFRVVNFELFAKPNKYVMAFGLTAISFCAGYLFYLNVYDKDRERVYVGINEDGSKLLRTRNSKWD